MVIYGKDYFSSLFLFSLGLGDHPFIRAISLRSKLALRECQSARVQANINGELRAKNKVHFFRLSRPLQDHALLTRGWSVRSGLDQPDKN